MASPLSPAQLTGQDESHLVELPDGHRLQPEAAEAFLALQVDAREAGFDLVIASSFRSFDRQLAIFNGKAGGSRPVFDDEGGEVPMGDLEPAAQLAAILRYSALPGGSRHHWGTDLDVFDAAALPEGYRLELSPREVAPGGLFDPLHSWLDARMAVGESHGFFRPYGSDTGGVAPERWHLSYAPLSAHCESTVDATLLRSCWDRGEEPLLLRDEIEGSLEELLARYVAVAPGWCPSH